MIILIDSDTNNIWSSRNNPRRSRKKIGRTIVLRKTSKYPDCSTAKTGGSDEMMGGELRKVTITQTPGKKPSIKTYVKSVKLYYYL